MLDRLSEAQNHRCAYCGSFMCDDSASPLMATIDHFVPRSLGGSNEWENLVAACWACNGGRGNRDAFEYYEYVRVHGRIALCPGGKSSALSAEERRALRYFDQALTGTQRLMLLKAMTEMNARLQAEGKPTLCWKDVMQEVLARGIGANFRFRKPAALVPSGTS